jgi:glycosyltransferase involved in cell wall biosynthesis
MDRFEHRARPSDGPITFYHPVAPAMLDRNGTKVVLDALRHVTEPCRVVFRSPGQPSPWSDPSRLIGAVEALWLDQDVPMYWDAYPPETDVLVMPRRYGGLCLPVLEAAAQGIPALMTDLSPQASWPGVHRVAPVAERSHSMKGGEFPVWDTNPKHLARAMDQLCREPERVAKLSDAAYEWAWANSWTELLPVWAGTLG